ncbi:hypothetical protein QYM36_007350 [Artemia franciscana]|uniref:Uncharacterized protein n=1 Tax=Artemia franciscana TaxID=6661 RepID=A0AA88HU62_ARTSF|nr:hypothetical protein QYM36_007350 [Artemia franciscana]
MGCGIMKPPVPVEPISSPVLIPIEAAPTRPPFTVAPTPQPSPPVPQQVQSLPIPQPSLPPAPFVSQSQQAERTGRIPDGTEGTIIISEFVKFICYLPMFDVLKVYMKL